MNRETQSVVLMLFGGVLIGITASGRFTSYVKPGFGPLLLIAGIILVLIGLLSLGQTVVGELRRARRTAGRTSGDGQPADSAADRGAQRTDGAGSGEFGGAPATGADGEFGRNGTVGATGEAAAGESVDGGGPVDAHGHAHQRSRAPWLILAPVLLLLLVAPAALGADAVSRNAGSQAIAGLDAAPSAVSSYDVYAFNDGSGTVQDSKGRRTMQFDLLPAGADPVISLKDFVMRSLYESQPVVTTIPVTLVGFVAPAGDGFRSGYTLARLTISCCAADASPIRVHIDGSGGPYPVNTWVAVVGTAVDGSGTSANDFVPTVKVSSVKQVQQPADPYEH
jgi:uncharacterized repeat protein (TIGR03943 family)